VTRGGGDLLLRGLAADAWFAVAGLRAVVAEECVHPALDHREFGVSGQQLPGGIDLRRGTEPVTGSGDGQDGQAWPGIQGVQRVGGVEDKAADVGVAQRERGGCHPAQRMAADRPGGDRRIVRHGTPGLVAVQQAESERLFQDDHQVSCIHSGSEDVLVCPGVDAGAGIEDETLGCPGALR
jgi:hypothetical protein